MFEMSMEWFESFEDIDLTFIYVSNGDDAALKFYLSRGFTFSNDVWGGFISQSVYFVLGLLDKNYKFKKRLKH